MGYSFQFLGGGPQSALILVRRVAQTLMPQNRGVRGPISYWLKKRERLSVGTVPTDKMHPVGTLNFSSAIFLSLNLDCIAKISDRLWLDPSKSDFPTPFHYFGFHLNGYLFASWKETSLTNIGLHKF